MDDFLYLTHYKNDDNMTDKLLHLIKYPLLIILLPIMIVGSTIKLLLNSG